MINNNNKQFKSFVKLLSASDKKRFRALIGVEYNQFRNWTLGNSKIPTEMRDKINSAATAVATDIVNSFFTDLKIKTSINLFIMEKTTILIELARKKLQQKELAEAIGVSEATVSNLVRQKKNKRIDLKTASAIADYFSLKISDFKEFSF